MQGKRNLGRLFMFALLFYHMFSLRLHCSLSDYYDFVCLIMDWTVGSCVTHIT